MSAEQEARYHLLQLAIAGDLDAVDAVFGTGGPSWMPAATLATTAPTDSRIDSVEGELFERTVLIGYADLDVEETSHEVDVGALLPCGAAWVSFKARLPETFVGSGISAVTASLGVAGSETGIMNAASVAGATPDIGTDWTQVNAGTPALLGAGVDDQAKILCTISATGGNLSALTAGSIEVVVLCVAP